MRVCAAKSSGQRDEALPAPCGSPSQIVLLGQKKTIMPPTFQSGLTLVLFAPTGMRISDAPDCAMRLIADAQSAYLTFCVAPAKSGLAPGSAAAPVPVGNLSTLSRTPIGYQPLFWVA